MRDYIYIGSTPLDEPCLPAGSDTYAQGQECLRYRALLREFFGEERGTASLRIKRQEHDFGQYFEIVCYYDDDDEIGLDYALKCESEGPLTWDDKGPYVWKPLVNVENSIAILKDKIIFTMTDDHERHVIFADDEDVTPYFWCLLSAALDNETYGMELIFGKIEINLDLPIADCIGIVNDYIIKKG